MKMIRYILLFGLVYAGFSHGEYIPSVSGMQRLSIICNTAEQKLFVMSFIDDPDVEFLKLTRALDEPIDVLVAANTLVNFKNALLSHGIKYTVTVNDVEQAIREEAFLNDIARERAQSDYDSRPFSYYPRYEKIEDFLSVYTDIYSDISSLEEIGTTYEGRSLYAVKISSGGTGKPKILIDAGIHAREWIAPVTALYAIHQLLTNESNAALYRDVDWYIIPSLNPDGYEFTHTTYRFWRKTRSINNGSLCFGADANRNFELKWMTVGASRDPCSDTYAGKKPFSEVETQALRDFVLSHNKTIKVYLTVHSYGQYLLHPWGYTSQLPENEPELRSVGIDAANALAAKYGTKYVVGSSTNVLYAAAGGSDDWVMGIAGADLSYTIELPGGRFDPPPSKIEPVGIETFEAFKIFHAFVQTKYVNSQHNM